MRIHGTATFEAGTPAFQDANLIIRLEDTSLADAPARLVAQTVLHDVSWNGDPAQTLPFTLDVPDGLAPHIRHELRLHLDRTRSGEITRGDFITTQAHPVDLGKPTQQPPIALRWLEP